jgi:hypothetical protein
MLSTALFSSNGSIYHQIAVFTRPNFQLNQTALDEVGLPALTGSNAWSGLTSSLAIGGLIAHCIFFWGPYVASSLKHAREKTQPDPHWVAMQKYEEAPWWWYMILLVLAFFAGEGWRDCRCFYGARLTSFLWVLRRSYQCAPWRNDAARLVVHRSADLWRDRHAILDAPFCTFGQRNCYQPAFQDDCWIHQPRKARCEPLCGLTLPMHPQAF